jgi:hypothetical protein
MRGWCETGQVVHKRKRGKAIVTDPEATPKTLNELELSLR